MQRTAICLVAVLALLAGCSGGVGGGSDATTTPAATPELTTASTPTPTPRATATPTPTSALTPTPSTNETETDSTSAITHIDRASVDKQQVLEGELVRFNTTLSNLNDTVANQSVSIQVGNRTVFEDHIGLAPRETRTGTLFTLNTSVIQPGEKFVTISTGNDSELLRLDIRPQNELETFIDNVRLSSLSLENSTILGRDHVRLTFDTEEDVTELYKGGGSNLMPVPQAAAFEMATSAYAPSKVTVQHSARIDNGPIPYRTSFNKSLATKLYSGAVDAREFRDRLHERATGAELHLLTPHWLRLSTPQPERFTFFTGDRARQEYASNMAERLNNTNIDYITVSDYGLHNGTQRLPDTTRKLGPNSSIYVTIKMDNIYRQVQHKGVNRTRHGVGVYQTLWKFGNMTQYKTYGERPEFVQLRFVWPDGVKHTIINIPTYMALETVKLGDPAPFYLPLVFDSPFIETYEDQRE